MKNMAFMLILAGAILIGVGLVVLLVGKAPWLGHLPGDMHCKGKNWSFSFPLVTCIVISVLLTIVLNMLFKLKGK